jgi:hypothetical protein
MIGVRRLSSLALSIVLVLWLGAAPVHGACNPAICAGDPCTITGTHDLDNGCWLNLTGKTVTIAASAVLRSAISEGSFRITAKSITLNGTLRSEGGTLEISVIDFFNMPLLGSLIDLGATQPNHWGDVYIEAGGAATLRNVRVDGGDYGGDIYVDAGSVTVTGTLQATGKSVGGYIELNSYGSMNVTGTLTASGTGTALADGGEIDLYPIGDLRLGAASFLRVNGVNGGSGGTVYVVGEGAATVDGDLQADGAGADAWGGDISFDAVGITCSGDLSADGGGGSFAGGGWIWVTSYANLVTAGTASMRATAIGGGVGGEVVAQGDGDVTLAGTFTATGGGVGSRGGRVWAMAGVARKLTVTGTMDVRSTLNGVDDGLIELVGCDVVVGGTLNNNRHPSGTNRVDYRGSLTVTSTGSVLGGTAPMGGNYLSCTCAGLDLMSGTCPASPVCVAAPVKQPGATVTPDWTHQPGPLAPCVGCSDGTRNLDETDVDCGGSTCGKCDDGEGCLGANDCTSGVCQSGVCKAGTCTDGVHNQNETGVDCGGANACPRCDTGEACGVDDDCISVVCTGGTCRPSRCDDARTNGKETDFNCGGPDCQGCDTDQHCLANSDCKNHICTGNKCQAPSCSDGVQNGDETDRDCGGSCPTKCDDLEHCLNPGDCKSLVCTGTICQVPTCLDGVQNGKETDKDCGGGTCVKCDDLLHCNVATDCKSDVCSGGVCQAPTCTDAKRNGMETGVDCGGGICPKCPSGSPCGVDVDCVSLVCDGGKCQDPTCSDRARNGNETDLNCGGGTCPKCLDWKRCIEAERDCVSGVCDRFSKACPLGICPQGFCKPPACDDGVKNGKEKGVDCGGGTCPGCPVGNPCDNAADCESKLCSGGCGPICQKTGCDNHLIDGSETDIDCGGGSCPACDFGKTCKTGSDCASGECAGGTCQCRSEEFVFRVDSSAGSAGDWAEWPAGQDTKTQPGGCGVTVNFPDDYIHEVCSLGAPFSVAANIHFSSCSGNCESVDCDAAGIVGSCCWQRPACTSPLTTGHASYRVKCTP